jgi:hypothetical protein
MSESRGIDYKHGIRRKTGRFGSLAGVAPFGRLLLQQNRTAERKAADQAPFSKPYPIFKMNLNFLN